MMDRFRQRNVTERDFNKARKVSYCLGNLFVQKEDFVYFLGFYQTEIRRNYYTVSLFMRTFFNAILTYLQLTEFND